MVNNITATLLSPPRKAQEEQQGFCENMEHWHELSLQMKISGDIGIPFILQTGKGG